MTFITFRRYYLDQFLSGIKFYGKVLDIGGKKNNKRGTFCPPLEKVERWVYLNIDNNTNPDYCCSAETIPIDNNIFDIILMTEVLEHLEDPEKVIKEIHRVLKIGGLIIATIPFLYPIHADPLDFQRWTSSKIKLEFEKVGFNIKSIEPMGGFFAVLYDLLRVFQNTTTNNSFNIYKKGFYKAIKPILVRLFMLLDNKWIQKNKFITTGYCIIALNE